MSIENWTLYIQERLRAYDPEIDLNAGAPATVQIVDPIVNRLSPDPIETDPLKFILARLQQEYPEVYAREGSAIADLFVKTHLVLLEPYRREIRSIRDQLSLQYPDRLTADEADALVANYFLSRRAGDYARVRVRIYYQNPVSVNISTVNVAYTARGLRFLPVETQSITAEAMLFNVDGNLYYFDVNYIAERPGTAYNVASGEIAGVVGLTAATRATNLAKASPGTAEETTPAFIARAEESIGERSLTNVSGIVSQLFETYSELQTLQIIGFNDVEMQRDVLTGGNLGEILYFGADGATADDGDVDGYTTYFDVVSSIDFTATFGPVGTDISGYTLTAIFPTGPVDYRLSRVLGATRVSTSETGANRFPEPHAALDWMIRKSQILTLSGVPGGILFPDVGGTTLDVPDNEVHVGNCTDLYVRGGTPEDKALAVELVADQLALARREDARTTNGSPWITLQDLTDEEKATVVAGETSLVLEEGSDAGSYRILEISGAAPYQVRVSTNMTGPGVVTDISYVLVDDLDVDLLEPKEIRYVGDDLKTIAGQPILSTVSGLPDFTSVGVVDTDYVEILNGEDAGTYAIAVGGVAAAQITLQTNMTITASPLQYRIYRRQTGIDLPLLRVTSIERLDSTLEPTGEMIPYRHPIEALSRSFQNPGRGAKAGTAIEATSDDLTRDALNFDVVASSGLINYYQLGVREGDIVNILTSDNQGYYTVAEVGGHPSAVIADNELRVDRELAWPASGMEYAVGDPSYGSFRLRFVDPCTFSVTADEATFSVTDASGATLSFRPDPNLLDEFLPTASTVPTITLANGSGTVVPYSTDGGTNIDALRYGVQVGDRVEITRYPSIGSVDLAPGSINLDAKTLRINVGYGVETVTFSGTALSADEVISQLNAQLSRSVAVKYEDPVTYPGEYYAMLRGDHEIAIEDNSAAGAGDATAQVFGTDRSKFQPWLAGTFVGVQTSNDAPTGHGGYFLVDFLASYPTGALTLTETDGSVWASSYDVPNTRGPYIHVNRSGRQRISSTAMADQMDDLGYYYFDVECISEGHGDFWNIEAELQATIAGYDSEGWEINTEDENTSYSMAEAPWIAISPRILIVGNEDDPGNYRELSGDNIQIAYERDPLVEQIHDYVRDPQTRDVCQNPLVRSLFPVFVRTAITYTGGSTEADIREDLTELIEAVRPEDSLAVSSMVKTIEDTGASKVNLPISLTGIAHQSDRTISLERSEDALYVSRLAALIPDDAGTDAGASYLILTRVI